MKHAALLLLLPLLVGARAGPETPTDHIVMPVFSRVFDFHTPDAFAPQPLQRNDQQVLLEFLAKGETFDTWTRLITVRGFRGIGASPMATSDLAKQLFEPKGCLKAGGVAVGPEQVIVGSLKRSTIVISCGRSQGNAYAGDKAGGGEQDVMYLFRDNAHIYTLQYAMRGASFDTPPIDVTKAGAILDEQFGPVLLCGSSTEPGCVKTIEFARTNGAPL